MKRRMFTDSVYGTQFVLAWDGSNSQFENLIREYDKKFEDDGDDFKGRCIDFTGSPHVVLIMLKRWRQKNLDSMATLTHECFHATEFVMKHRDIPHSRKTSEAWAYFLDSIFAKCLELLS